MHTVLTLERLSAMDPDAAAALLVYRRAEGAGDLDAQVATQWLNLDPSHQLALAAAEAAWGDFDEADGDEILAALRADALAAGPLTRPRWTREVVAAAAVIMVLVGSALGLAVWREDVVGVFGPHSERYVATSGQPLQIQLADGSRMTLATGSAASVSLGRHRRAIGLERGSARFDVAHDGARPFAVRADDLEVLAIGTRFEVTISPRESRVILEQGRVSVREVSSHRDPVLLVAGQQFVGWPGQAPSVTRVQSLKNDPDQAGDFIEFRNVTLGEAVAAINARGGGRLIVRDPAVAALRVSGRFKADDLPRFGRSLSLLHPVQMIPRGPGAWEIVGAKRR